MKRILMVMGVSLVLVLLAACSPSYAADDPLPENVTDVIDDFDSIVIAQPEPIDAIQVAVTVVHYNAEQGGTVGDVCNAVALVRPDIETQLAASKASTAGDHKQISHSLNDMLNALKKIDRRLGCDRLAEKP